MSDAKAGWRVLRTESGIPYYHNTVTEELSATRPRELFTEDEIQEEGTGEWMWISDPEKAFVAATVLEELADGMVEVKTQDGMRRTVNRKDTSPLSYVSLRQQENDMVHCEDMSHPFILHNLRERLRNKKIYTSIGDVLVAMNPYVRLPLYGVDQVEEYTRSSVSADPLPPHIFHVADTALNSLLYAEARKNQSVIISGESGAGKTETTKQVLHFLAEVAGGTTQKHIEDKIICANPVLEAFGNAKTIRNDNSSRFGKYCEVFFKGKEICGAKNTNYLLEKSRLVRQGPDERNFHIFYQLVKGCDRQQREMYSLPEDKDPSYFNYLNQSGCTDVDTINDKECFAEVLQALQTLEFDDGETDDLFRICAALLHLGNVAFEASVSGDMDSLAVVANTELSQDAFKATAKLLRVEEQVLASRLTSRVMQVGNRRSVSTIALKPPQAEDSRDALAKFIYTKMFDWLIERVNQAYLGRDGETSRLSIGILDIFGFEIFETNSLEQLCINLANEKLQRQFNANTFALEEKVYKAEDIGYVSVGYTDNQGVLDLIEGKGLGVLPILDEELRLPSATNDTFEDKMFATCKDSEFFSSNLKQPGIFIVQHYAGSVAYDVKGFFEKNKDKMPPDMEAMVTNSDDAFMRSLFTADARASSSGGRGSIPRLDRQLTPVEKAAGMFKNKIGKAKSASLSGKFRSQLDELMAALEMTQPQYVRCIKSNSEKKPLHCEANLTLEQLTYSGVFEVIAIRKRGYPYRLPHGAFARRYACVDKTKQISGSDVEVCQKLAKMMKTDEHVVIGKTMCLYKVDTHRTMELHRALAVETTVLKIQTWFRMAWRQKRYLRVKKAKAQLLEFVANVDINTEDKLGLRTQVENLDAVLAECNKLGGVQGWMWQVGPHIEAATDAQALTREAYEVQSELNKILGSHKTPEQVYEDVRRLLRHSKRIGKDGFSTSLHQRAREKIQPIQDKKDCAEALSRAVRDTDEELIRKALSKADELRLKEPDLIAKAKEVLTVIQKEKDILHALETGTRTGAWISPGDQISWAHLEKNVEKSAQFGMKTRRGMFLERLNTKLIGLRQAMQPAVESEEDEKAWDRVALVLGGLRKEDEKESERVQGDEELDSFYKTTREELRMCDAPEVVSASEELQRVRDVRACAQALEQGLALFDEAKLAHGLELADKLGMNPDNETLKKASAVLEAIRACRDIAVAARNEALKAESEYGVTKAVQEKLQHVAEEVRVHPGAEGMAEVVECMALLSRCEAESALVARMRDGLTQGGWTNEGVDSGNYDSYQGQNAIDIETLSGVLRDSSALPNEPLTQAFRGWLSLSKLGFDFRKRLYEAVKTQDVHLWRAVRGCIDKLEGDEKDDDSRVGRLPAHPLPREIARAKEEADYQDRVSALTQEVSKAHIARDQPTLEGLLQQCKELNMREEYNKEVAEGKRILSLMVQCTAKLATGMSRCDVASLAAALELAAQFGYETDQVTSAREAHAVLLEVTDAMALFDQDRMEASLAQAQEQGLESSTVLLTQANGLLAAIKGATALAELSTAQSGDGYLPLHRAALEAVRVRADLFGGLSQASEVVSVRTALAAMEAEERAVAAVDQALRTGAWFNHGVVHGDYAKYKVGSSIDASAIAPVLEVLKATGLGSFDGRRRAALATLAVALRPALANAVGKQDDAAWAAVANVLTSGAAMLQEEVPPAEVLAAANEARYQAAVRATTAALVAATAAVDGPALKLALRDAAIHGMQAAHNPAVQQGKALLGRIRSCRQAMREATALVSESGLDAVLEEAAAMGLQTAEVVKATTLRDEVKALHGRAREAVENMEAKQLEDVVTKAAQLHLVSEPIQAAMQAHMTSLHEPAAWLEIQLGAAEKLGDAPRVLALKGAQRTLEVRGSDQAYAWPYAPILSGTIEWVKRQGMSWSKARRAAGMTKYTAGLMKGPISLVNLELSGSTTKELAEINRLCSAAFSDLKMIMHPGASAKLDRKTLIAQLQAFMGKGDWYTDELYCQVMKQLTDCPIIAARKMGWMLLGGMMRHRPPSSKAMQCVVEQFCISHHHTAIISFMHKSIFEKGSDSIQMDDEAVSPPDHTGWNDAEGIMPTCCFCCC